MLSGGFVFSWKKEKAFSLEQSLYEGALLCTGSFSGRVRKCGVGLDWSVVRNSLDTDSVKGSARKNEVVSVKTFGDFIFFVYFLEI